VLRKFYKFLDVEFHDYEISTPIGESNELPIHFKEVQTQMHKLNIFLAMSVISLIKPVDPINMNNNEFYSFCNFYSNIILMIKI
jgi:hypothetical protein